jgi:hypothetical protein
MANFEPYSGYKFERTQFVARELLGGKVKKNKKNHQMHKKHQKHQYHRSSCPECESLSERSGDPAKGGIRAKCGGKSK